MNNVNLSQERLKTLSNQRSNISKKNSSLRELQLDMINSLSKSPLVKVKRSSFKNLNQDLDNYSDYINKMNNRLNRYQINFSPEKFAEIENENDLGPNEK